MASEITGCVAFFFSSRRRHTIFDCDWSSDVCSSDLISHPPTGRLRTEFPCSRGPGYHRHRRGLRPARQQLRVLPLREIAFVGTRRGPRSEEHTSELQSQSNLVCRLLLEKKKTHSHFASSLSHKLPSYVAHLQHAPLQTPVFSRL